MRIPRTDSAAHDAPSFPGSAWERTPRRSASRVETTAPRHGRPAAADAMQSIADLRSQAEPGNEGCAPGIEGRRAWYRDTRSLSRFIRRLHRDEHGVISIASVLAIFMFTILLA